MTRSFVPALLVAIGSSLTFVAGGAAEAADRLACEDVFGPKSSHEAVVAKFGAANVKVEKIDGAEGEQIAATVIFPSDPARRLELTWWDDKTKRGLAAVGLPIGSSWIAPNGLALGASLAEAEKANGRPFVLSGFEWDYGGTVTDWKGGALAGPFPGGCVVSVTFLPSPSASDAARAAVAGDKNFPSNDRRMKAVSPIVDRLSIGYPQ